MLLLDQSSDFLVFLHLEGYSLFHSVQTGSGINPASYTLGMRAVSLGVNWQGREADHLFTSNAEVKNG
jgi:hypothetical protein